MTRSAWNEPGPMKLIRPTNIVMMDALAHNTMTLRAHGHGHAMCMIKSIGQEGDAHLPSRQLECHSDRHDLADSP